MFTNVEDIQKFGKQQLEAATAATQTFSKGLQEIAAETSDYSKKAIAANTPSHGPMPNRSHSRADT